MKKAVLNILRWLLVLPAAVFALNVIYNMVLFPCIFAPSWMLPLLYYLLEFNAGCVGAFGFVYFGAYVAPKYKTITSIVLCVVYGAYISYALIDPFHLYEDVNVWEDLFYKAGQVVAVVLAVYAVKSKYEE